MAGSLSELASLPQSQFGPRPFVEVLQREGAAVQGDRLQIREAGIVAQGIERLVNTVQRGGMVAPDGMDQPQVVQGLHRRERIADLLGGG